MLINLLFIASSIAVSIPESATALGAMGSETGNIPSTDLNITGIRTLSRGECLKDDVNSFCIEQNGKVMWNSETCFVSCLFDAEKLVVQDDGNLVLYDNDSKVLWASKFSGKPTDLIMEKDRVSYRIEGNNGSKHLWYFPA